MELKEVQKFFEAAMHYCNFVETSLADYDNSKLSQLLISISLLYTQALFLLEVESENTDIADFDLDLPKVDFAQNDTYWEVFEPYKFEEPIRGSLSDDILDIYRNIKEGVFLYQKEERVDSVIG